MTGTIVAGIGATEFSKESGRSEMQLAAEASRAAILDAGLTPADIDGMVTFTVDANDEQELIRNLGAGPVTWWSRAPGGGTGACAAMQQAVAAVAAGLANNVLVYRAFNERSGFRYGQPHATATASENESGGSSVTATLTPGQATAHFPPEIAKFRTIAQDTLALADFEVDVVEHVKRAEPFVDMAHLDHRPLSRARVPFGHCPPPSFRMFPAEPCRGFRRRVASGRR